jgi:hypothetical protein
VCRDSINVVNQIGPSTPFAHNLSVTYWTRCETVFKRMPGAAAATSQASSSSIPSSASAQDSQAEKQGDELAARGLANAELVLRGDRYNLYLTRSIRNQKFEFAAIHRVTETASLLELVPAPSRGNDAFDFGPTVMQDFQRNILPLAKARSPHVMFVTVRHFARGYHREDDPGTSDVDQVPLMTVAFRYAFYSAQGGWEIHPAGLVLGHTRDRNTIAQARVADAHTLQVREQRDAEVEREVAAEKRAEAAALERQRQEDERRKAEKERLAAAEARRGLRIEGEIPWSSYVHGAVMEDLFTGNFNKRARFEKDAAMLYMNYVDQFWNMCGSHVSANRRTLDFTTTHTTVNGWGQVLHSSSEHTGSVTMDARFLDMYKTYYDGPATLQYFMEYARGKSFTDMARDMIGWITDLKQFFSLEACQGATSRQMGENLFRFASGWPPLQGEDNPAAILAGLRVPVDLQQVAREESARQARLTNYRNQVRAVRAQGASLMQACHAHYPQKYCACVVPYVQEVGTPQQLAGLQRNFYSGLEPFGSSRTHRARFDECSKF